MDGTTNHTRSLATKSRSVARRRVPLDRCQRYTASSKRGSNGEQRSPDKPAQAARSVASNVGKLTTLVSGSRRCRELAALAPRNSRSNRIAARRRSRRPSSPCARWRANPYPPRAHRFRIVCTAIRCSSADNSSGESSGRCRRNRARGSAKIASSRFVFRADRPLIAITMTFQFLVF